MKQILQNSLIAGVAISFSLAANAQGYTFPGGTGTSSDPYQIVTAEDLSHVADYLNNSSVCFLLMNDIDLSEFLDGGSWTPIGDSTSNAFTGTFDGGGHTISNMVILGGANGLGMFGRINTPGVVKNLTLDYAEVSGGDWCGILCSTNGNWEVKGGIIDNCHVTNSYLEGAGCLGAIAGVCEGTVTNSSGFNNEIVGLSVIGGLFGECQANDNQAYINNCFSYAIVTGTTNVGGIAGQVRRQSMEGREAEFQNLAVYGSINGTSAIGGIAGYQQGIADMTFDKCFSCADIYGNSIGGIGGSPIDGKIQNCYAMGSLTATGGDQVWSGGIAGTAYQSITSCYFAGQISGEGSIGGICGRNWPTLVVANCYYNTDGASMNMGEGNDEATYDAKGLLPEEMTSGMMTFNDASKWVIPANGYPYFTNQAAPVVITEATVDGASGTYTGDVDELFLFCSTTGGIMDVEYTLDNGTWTATWPELSVMEGEVLNVFAKSEGGMPSQLASMRIGASSSIADTSIDETEATVTTSGNEICISLKGCDNMNYRIVNLAGITMTGGQAVGPTTTIDASRLAKGLYLVVTENGNYSKTSKVVVK